MNAPARAMRKVAMLLAAVSSVAGGVLLVWRFVSVERVGAVSTAPLVALLGLFILPAVTIGALELDRRSAARRRALARSGAAGAEPARPGGSEAGRAGRVHTPERSAREAHRPVQPRRREGARRG